MQRHNAAVKELGKAAVVHVSAEELSAKPLPADLPQIAQRRQRASFRNEVLAADRLVPLKVIDPAIPGGLSGQAHRWRRTSGQRISLRQRRFGCWSEGCVSGRGELLERRG